MCEFIQTSLPRENSIEVGVTLTARLSIASKLRSESGHGRDKCLMLKVLEFSHFHMKILPVVIYLTIYRVKCLNTFASEYLLVKVSEKSGYFRNY